MEILTYFLVICYITHSRGVTPAQIETKGIDCDHAKTLQTADINQLCSANESLNSFPKLGEIEITVVQHDPIRLVKGMRCKRFESKFNFHCGMSSHLSLDGLFEIRRPVDVPMEQCNQIIMDKRLTIETGKTISLPNSQNNFNFHYNFLRAGSLIQDTHSVSCEGTIAHLSGKEIYGDLELIEVEFIVSETKFEVTDTQIKDLITHEILPPYCYNSAQCTLPSKDLLYFTRGQNLCTLFQIRNLIMEKTIIKVQDRDQTVYVNREHKIIFIRGQETSAHASCFQGSQRVFETQIPGILVMKTKRTLKTHITEISAERIDPQLQLTMVEDYFNYHLQEKLAKFIRNVHADFCKLNRHTLSLIELSPFHENAIIKVNGEILQELQCTLSTVYIVPKPNNKKCLSAIPVGIRGNTKYMMAGTRILVEEHETHEVDCILAPKYVINNQVIVANPDVQILDVELSKFSLLRQAENGLNAFDKFELSGDSNLYTSAEMEKFIQLIHYQRGQETVKEMLTSAYCETGGCGTYSERSTLASGLDFRVLKSVKDQLDSLNVGKIVWGILKEYAIYWSIYLFVERVFILVLKLYTCLKLKPFKRGEAFKLSFFSGNEMRKLLTESARAPEGTVTMSHLERLDANPDSIELMENISGEDNSNLESRRSSAPQSQGKYLGN